MVSIRRKVIQIAESTQLVSLPRKWALKNNIKKGDEIEVNEEGNNIIITTKNSELAPPRTEINLGSNEEFIKYLLHGLYKRGYEEAKINFDKPSTIAQIQEVIHKEMIGFEVVEQSAHSCVVKAIAGGFESEFETMLRRTFLLLKTMSEEVLNALKREDSATIRSLLYLENDINKYTCFCRRIINKRGWKDPRKVTYMYCIVDEIERIADEYKYLCSYISSNGKEVKKIDKETIALIEDVTKLVNESYELFYKFKMDSVMPIFKKRKEIISKALAIIGPKRCQNFLHFTINIAQRLQDLTRFKLEMEL